MAFKWHKNGTRLLVDERGHVKNTDYLTVPHEIDDDGHHWVKVGGEKYFVPSLVLANHGVARDPKPNESISYKNHKSKDPALENIYYKAKEEKVYKRAKNWNNLPDGGKEFIEAQIKMGKTDEEVNKAFEEQFPTETLMDTAVGHIRNELKAENLDIKPVRKRKKRKKKSK